LMLEPDSDQVQARLVTGGETAGPAGGGRFHRHPQRALSRDGTANDRSAFGTITAQQIQRRPKHSNPLTGFGRATGEDSDTHCTMAWRAAAPFRLPCHLDLDHFQGIQRWPYGYARGATRSCCTFAQVRDACGTAPRSISSAMLAAMTSCFSHAQVQDWSLRLTAIVEELEASLMNFSFHRAPPGGRGSMGLTVTACKRRFPLPECIDRSGW